MDSLQEHALKNVLENSRQVKNFGETISKELKTISNELKMLKKISASKAVLKHTNSFTYTHRLAATKIIESCLYD